MIQENKVASKYLASIWSLLQRASSTQETLCGPILNACGLEMAVLDKVDKGGDLEHNYFVQMSSSILMQIKEEYMQECVNRSA